MVLYSQFANTHCIQDYGFLHLCPFKKSLCTKEFIEICCNLQHLFASEQREDIIKSAIEHAGNFVGISLRIRKELLEFEQYLSLRFGKYSNDESITSLAEFVVQKITPRHSVRFNNLNALFVCQSLGKDPLLSFSFTLSQFLVIDL